jgi:hypothetical protein
MGEYSFRSYRKLGNGEELRNLENLLIFYPMFIYLISLHSKKLLLINYHIALYVINLYLRIFTHVQKE